MFRFRLTALVAVGSVALAACGGTSPGASGSPTKGEIAIGVDLPESGAASSSGLPTLHGVEYAVQLANAAGGAEGYKLIVDNHDDAVGGSYNEQKGVQNVQEMLANKKVLAMVGPFNSAVAKAEIPIAAPQHFTMISPSNTNPCLTVLAPAYCDYDPLPLRKGNANNYFRVVTNDTNQGPAMADYAFKTLNIKKIAILNDSTVFGKGIALAFKKRWTDLTGTVAVEDSYDPNTATDWRSFLTRAKTAGAQAVYVGGTDDKKACLPRAQMKGLDFVVPYLGGDGIETTQCVTDSGDSALGVSATSAGADADQIPEAKAVADGFRKVFAGSGDYGTYTMSAFDATNIIIAGIRRAIKANGGKVPSRDQVRAEVAKTKDFKGVLGVHTFDAAGDTSVKIVSVFSVKQVTAAQAKGQVCGKDAKATLCFVWVTQFNFAN
jgi:branched-chain amino acid transport system substrate-binding protein